MIGWIRSLFSKQNQGVSVAEEVTEEVPVVQDVTPDPKPERPKLWFEITKERAIELYDKVMASDEEPAFKALIKKIRRYSEAKREDCIILSREETQILCEILDGQRFGPWIIALAFSDGEYGMLMRKYHDDDNEYLYFLEYRPEVIDGLPTGYVGGQKADGHGYYTNFKRRVVEPPQP